MESFREKLDQCGARLERGRTHTLQINVGLLCNQACKHCHLTAGPGRTEIMDEKTVDQVVDFAARGGFTVADITGGATEMNPHLMRLIEQLSSHVETIMVRSNLTAVSEKGRENLLEFFARSQVRVVASFPALAASQTDAQRGAGVHDQSLFTLKKLNSLGFGMPGSGLGLDLVLNPAGAFLPPDQDQAARRYRQQLLSRHNIQFHNLFAFANAPLGRFRDWLKKSGNYQPYMEKLVQGFNPCAVDGVMCRNLVSVDWAGYLYDCDFNQAAGIPLAGKRTHVSELSGPPEPGLPIAVGDHCFTCTAGAGFT